MKKTFITSNGSIELERNILFIKNRKFIFYETGFARIAWSLLPPVLLVLVFFTLTDPFRLFMQVVFFGLLTLDRIPTIYNLLFITSFSKRIPVEKIESVDAIEDKNRLEVQLLLHLKNKRVRTIPFRKLEKQYEELIETISLQPSNMGIA